MCLEHVPLPHPTETSKADVTCATQLMLAQQQPPWFLDNDLIAPTGEPDPCMWAQ